VVVAAVLIIAAIAWAYTVYLAETGMGMGDMGMAMADMRSWSGLDFGLMFVMWAVMMVAMMTPSAAPMLLMFASVNRKRREREAPYVPTGVFLAGYVIMWAGFSLAATAGNWGLHQASLLSSMMGASTNGYLGGTLLLLAGVFQWSPLKYACLKQCRTPMGFLMTSWRDGRGGALRMGLEHGAYCLGCCWAVMLLLFVLGVMNLVWIAALAALCAGGEGDAEGRVGEPGHRRADAWLGCLGHRERGAVGPGAIRLAASNAGSGEPSIPATLREIP
jgi:predicted metal-binding membrane protein